MKKYRVTCVMEFKTELNLPDFDMRGDPKDIAAALEGILMPNSSQETESWTSVKIESVPIHTLDPY